MTPSAVARRASGRRVAGRRASPSQGGLTLLDLLVATGIALGVLAVVAAALPPVLDVVRAVPEAADLQQRVRATEYTVTSTVALAGAGADLAGEGPLSRAVPAILPRRVDVDAAGTAWADRFTTLHAGEGAAQAPVADPIPAGGTTVVLAWHPACGVSSSCGFRRGDVVLVYGRDGAMVLSTLAAAAGAVLTLTTPADQPVGMPAYAVAVTVTTFVFDPGRRQLRRVDGLGASQPVTEDVVAMQVRYYGTAAPPRLPAIPGLDGCIVDATGAPRLGLLGPVPGPPIELVVTDFTDGPWCGTGAWRYDADLLRVRAVRVRLRLQASSPAVRGQAPVWFLLPGQARRPAQEVRDVELDVFATAPNLVWGQ